MNKLSENLIVGLRTARANLVPIAILQTVAVLIAVAWYCFPIVTQWLDIIADLKRRGGYCYSMVSTAVWAGLIPLLLQHWQKVERREPLSSLPFLLSWWACMGLVIDGAFRLLAYLFGDNARPLTVVSKLLFDQLCFTPGIVMPLVVSVYAWKEGGFTLLAMREFYQPGWYADRVMPAVVSSWLVWTPALIAIYALPVALQLPIQNLVECLWVLFLMLLTRKPTGTAAVAPAGFG